MKHHLNPRRSVVLQERYLQIGKSHVKHYPFMIIVILMYAVWTYLHKWQSKQRFAFWILIICIRCCTIATNSLIFNFLLKRKRIFLESFSVVWGVNIKSLQWDDQQGYIVCRIRCTILFVYLLIHSLLNLYDAYLIKHMVNTVPDILDSTMSYVTKFWLNFWSSWLFHRYKWLLSAITRASWCKVGLY